MKFASGNEKHALQQLDPSFMSDEEDGEDPAGTWIVRSPAWRSSRLSSMLHKLQEKIDGQPSSHPQNSRVRGTSCTRPPPPSSPAWAVCADDNSRARGTPCTRPPPPSSPAWTVCADDRETTAHERSTSSLPTTPPRSQSSSEYDSGDENEENLNPSILESPVRISRRRRRVRTLQD